jgi:predicted unusual protein kinase regulating ubiquinone biosynthesis (AarF/ABC1/UbiB family)
VSADIISYDTMRIDRMLSRLLWCSPLLGLPHGTDGFYAERVVIAARFRAAPPVYLYASIVATTTSVPISETVAPLTSSSSSSSSEDIAFPPPMSEMGRLLRAVTFWSTAVPIIASYYGLIARIQFQQIVHKSTTATAAPLNQPLPEQLMEQKRQQLLWDAQHTDGAAKLAKVIAELKGFYVKTAQIIASRQDLFPVQYTDALAGFTDSLDPMPAAIAIAVIECELLHSDETFSDVFCEFDPVPVGSASVAQVHRARLTPKYGGGEVAVKVQRPSIESKLLGDIANLKAVTKTFRDAPFLPLDYYTVFCEVEKQLADEFDFVAEAVSMERIYKSLAVGPDGTPRAVPVVIPRPIPGLVCRRVLVMDYLEGVPLSRAREEMIKRGIDPDSPEAKLFGRKLLSALTQSFGRNILETGFFHAE